MWSVFGDQSSELTSVSENNDEGDWQVKGGGAARRSNGLSSLDLGGSEGLGVLIESSILNAALSLNTALSHDGNSFDWIASVSTLS